MFDKTKLFAAVAIFSVSTLAVSGVAKVYYEHTHIQQDEITVKSDSVKDMLDAEIIKDKKISAPIDSHYFSCKFIKGRKLPYKYTVTYNQNGSEIEYSLPNPGMIKKMSVDGMIHHNIVPFNDTIVNSSYHITPVNIVSTSGNVFNSKCDVDYDVKWQNTNYNKNMWFYWIW